MQVCIGDQLLDEEFSLNNRSKMLYPVLIGRRIDTPKREYFCWAAILFTFALGTAAGDWVSVRVRQSLL